MSTADLIAKILQILDEIVIPSVALWVAWQIRKWLQGDLQVPPYEHRVQIKSEPTELDQSAPPFRKRGQ